jgi:hypothetical protein
MKIYLAIAQTQDGNQILENAYTTKEAALSAADRMIKDISENTHVMVIPIIEEMDLLDE